MRLLIVSYFELRESLLCASNALKNRGYDVSYYPLLEKKQLYKQNNTGWVDDMTAFCRNKQIEVILWWYIGVPFADMKTVCENTRLTDCPAIHILFNWDDPYVWTDHENEMPDKASLFDLAFVSCQSSLELYERHGTGKAIYLLPGFDLGLHYYTPRDQVPAKYKSDISICCTNLYIDQQRYPDQLKPTRYDIVQELVKHDDIDFAIYGPESLKELFPDHYRCQVPYNETRLVFAGSKINICTHVVGNQQGYLSERVPLVLGSGGLLLLDKVQQTVITDQECIFITDYQVAGQIIEQVRALLNCTNPKDLESRRQKGFNMATTSLTWNHWADVIDRHLRPLCMKYYELLPLEPVPQTFDHIMYKWENFRNHTSLQTREQCWQHWIYCGHSTILRYGLPNDTVSIGRHCTEQLAMNDMKTLIALHNVHHNPRKLQALDKYSSKRLNTTKRIMELYWAHYKIQTQ